MASRTAAQKTLLLVGHETAAVRRAKAFGLHVVLLQQRGALDREQLQLADVTFVVDDTDWSVLRPLVESVDRVWGVDAALSPTEPGLDTAGRINDLLGLGGTGFEVTRRLRDTRLMRRQLAAMGQATIGAALAEEDLRGPAYGVEAFSFAGRHVVVAVTEKLVDRAGVVELGHTLPARIDGSLEQAIVAAVTRFLDVMGLRDGPTHSEVRIGPRGPVVIASRNLIGGDGIGDLVHDAYGIDLTVYAVGWPLRLVEELPERPRVPGAAGVGL
jgi:ATP-grasp domain